MPPFKLRSLPAPTLINGQASIPPPSAESFDAHFGGYLPERHILTSAWGQTAYYLLSNIDDTSNSSSPPKPHRRAILLHGASTPSITFLPLANALLSPSSNSPPTTLCLPDLYGHGLSSTPLLPPTPSLFYTQLLSLLATLQWPSAHIVGFSASSSFAVAFGADYPQLCDSVTLISPSGLLRYASMPWWTKVVMSGGPWGLWEGAATRNILDLIDGGPPPCPPADWRERSVAQRRAGGEGDATGMGRGIYDMDAVQVWQREEHAGHIAMLVGIVRYGGVYDLHWAFAGVARGPLGKEKRALVVLGETDEVFGGEAVMRELQPLGWDTDGGGVEVVMDVGHLVVREKPAETAEVLRGFWGRIERGEGVEG